MCNGDCFPSLIIGLLETAQFTIGFCVELLTKASGFFVTVSNYCHFELSIKIIIMRELYETVMFGHELENIFKFCPLVNYNLFIYSF